MRLMTSPLLRPFLIGPFRLQLKSAPIPPPVLLVLTIPSMLDSRALANFEELPLAREVGPSLKPPRLLTSRAPVEPWRVVRRVCSPE